MLLTDQILWFYGRSNMHCSKEEWMFDHWKWRMLLSEWCLHPIWKKMPLASQSVRLKSTEVKGYLGLTSWVGCLCDWYNKASQNEFNLFISLYIRILFIKIFFKMKNNTDSSHEYIIIINETCVKNTLYNKSFCHCKFTSDKL